MGKLKYHFGQEVLVNDCGRVYLMRVTELDPDSGRPYKVSGKAVSFWVEESQLEAVKSEV